MPPTAAPAPRAKARALALTRNDRRDDGDVMINLLPVVIDVVVDRHCSLRRRAESLSGLSSNEAEHRSSVEEGQAERPLQAWADEPQPCEMNESRAEERQEQPVASGGRDAENADALGLRAQDRKHRHDSQKAADHGEEH